jgi:hypothetical protein
VFDGNNSTDNTLGGIDVNIVGNVKSGVYDLDDGVSKVLSPDISLDTLGGTSAQSNFISVAFKLDHAAGNDMGITADYAIYADFCKPDQTPLCLSR